MRAETEEEKGDKRGRMRVGEEGNWELFLKCGRRVSVLLLQSFPPRINLS